MQCLSMQCLSMHSLSMCMHWLQLICLTPGIHPAAAEIRTWEQTKCHNWSAIGYCRTRRTTDNVMHINRRHSMHSLSMCMHWLQLTCLTPGIHPAAAEIVSVYQWIIPSAACTWTTCLFLSFRLTSVDRNTYKAIKQQKRRTTDLNVNHTVIQSISPT